MLCGAKQFRESRKALKRPNGTGTVYKLSGKRKRPWAAARNRVLIGCYETRTAALEALNKLSGKDIADRYNLTFAEVFEEWKKEHYRDITDADRSTYNCSFDVFEPLHSKKFRELKTADFQAMIDQHMSKTHSTVSKYKQLITQMSKWAVRDELITTNFASYVKLPENVKRKGPHRVRALPAARCTSVKSEQLGFCRCEIFTFSIIFLLDIQRTAWPSSLLRKFIR